MSHFFKLATSSVEIPSTQPHIASCVLYRELFRQAEKAALNLNAVSLQVTKGLSVAESSMLGQLASIVDSQVSRVERASGKEKYFDTCL